jgi:hypothetical protein
LKRVLITSLINNHLGFAFAPANWVFAHKLCIFPMESIQEWGVLQSSIHYCWAWSYSSTNLALLNYSPSDCLETFPFPAGIAGLDIVGKQYYQYRAEVMKSRQEGLTKTYNHFHDSRERSEDIEHLRALHVEMDHVVATAYGWTDLDMGHSFHETKQGVRYTISESARLTVLDRLLKLNHERYAEEVKAGLHDKKNKKTGSISKRRSKPKDTGSDTDDSLFH